MLDISFGPRLSSSVESLLRCIGCVIFFFLFSIPQVLFNSVGVLASYHRYYIARGCYDFPFSFPRPNFLFGAWMPGEEWEGELRAFNNGPWNMVASITYNRGSQKIINERITLVEN